MAKRYLVFLYSKYFFLILFSLTLFFVGLDFLQVFKKLPNSANLQVLYLTYKAMNGIDILFPISLVFAMISLKISLIRSNELVAFYALGIGKKAIIFPLFITAVALTMVYLILHLTSFTYADEYANNIKKYNSVMNTTKNLFFKYNNSYVYFKRLLPLDRSAEGVRVFEVNGTNIKKIVLADHADFKQNYWHITKASVIERLKERISIKETSLDTLVGYKPKILDSVYEGKTNISLLDAIYALKLFQSQKIDISKLKAVILFHLFYPFFAPLLMIVIFYFVPVSARIANLNLFSFGAILSTLVVWGVLYSFVKLAFAGSLQPEIAIVAPILILALIAFYFYKKF
ncbi:lipopolysaccharide export system permease protein [Nitratiruptor sp. YY08-26]|uniref:LptF/LptG family permease n=1 Tax=unclassified Nitratiruptor TaxID=2624044 RepID=UPI0019164802|nr:MULTISPECIES: LptF/LptG family permease [unclassified Nitratiruptor]BCD61570.1 lipopolysaccharide export system permease protein [Nitratiruptor sp. YY08-13]BCD65504.1 lipopolysaccharide export system permease protein [Nitratiruptor sp. YY08-26]